MNRILIAVVILFFSTNCREEHSDNICQMISDAAELRRLQTKYYLQDTNSLYIYNLYDSSMKLRNIREHGVGVELRLWVYRASDGYEQLYCLNYDRVNTWTGEKLTFILERPPGDSSRFSVRSNKKQIFKSKEQWEVFVTSVFDDGFLEFPDYHSVSPKSIGHTHATSIQFEASCGNKYLYYNYIFPSYVTDTIPGKVKKVVQSFTNMFQE